MVETKPKVAFVDDSATVRAVLKRALTDAGYEALCCESWDEVHEAVKERKPDLVLLDVEMPDVSGGSIAYVLKKTYPGVKVVYYSSVAEPMLKQLTETTGADGYISKEPDIDNLLAAVSSYLDGPERG